MNRRQKIIVSITGIFIVLLALVGLTYAYFLTRITGNENEKSISVTTANLELVYGDDSAEIIQRDTALMPTVKTDADDAIGTKTFTVTNNGNDSSYVVIIDNVEAKYETNGNYKDENGNAITYTKDQATKFVSNDFRFKLICKVKDKNGNILNDEKCYGANILSVFPLEGGILVGNTIPENRIHEYTLTLWYIDNGKDQSDDMNKSYQARINIADITQMKNPFKTGNTEIDSKNLAYNVIENAKINKNSTKLVNTPPSKIVEEKSLDNWGLASEAKIYLNNAKIPAYSENINDIDACFWQNLNNNRYNNENEDWNCPGVIKYKGCTADVIGKYVWNKTTDMPFYVEECDENKIVESKNMNERVLSSAVDDYGSSYYYRGNVMDNYVNFAGMCWRIVRIQGDGSIKLILEDKNYTCNSSNYTGNWAIGSGPFGYDMIDGNIYIIKYLNQHNNGMAFAFKNFQITIAKKINPSIGENPSNEVINNTLSSKLKSGGWCFGDKAYSNDVHDVTNATPLTEAEKMELEKTYSVYSYDAYLRLDYQKLAMLKCNGTIMNKFEDNITPMYVGTLTADEIVFAGNAFHLLSPVKYYLIDNLYTNEWFTLSPYINSGGVTDIITDLNGRLNYLLQFKDYYGNNSGTASYRPSITLKSGSVIIEGEGTIDNPYVIG